MSTRIQRGKRGVPVFTRCSRPRLYVDVAWYGNLPPTLGCSDKVQWLSAAEPFTWECWSRALVIYYLYFILFCSYLLSDTNAT